MSQRKQQQEIRDIDNNKYHRPEQPVLPKNSIYDKEIKHWANIANQYMLQPIYGGDGRVLIKVDEFKSKYACTACNGKGHTEKVCPRCNGTKLTFDGIADAPCTACAVGQTDGIKRYGYVLCDQCKGKQGTIIIPDTSQKNSESGDVLAISKTGINCLQPNMKVLTATYSGVPFKFMDIDFKIMVEKDVLGILRPLKQNVDGIQQGTYAELMNVGIAEHD